jgi:hypothetical protein
VQVISKCPALCLNSLACLQHAGDDSALVLHLHKFNLLVDNVLQLQNTGTHTDAPRMRQILARAFKGSRKKKAAVSKLVDSAHVLQVILQTIDQHRDLISNLAAQQGKACEIVKLNESSSACCGVLGKEFPQLTVTPNQTHTSSTYDAESTPGTKNLVNSVPIDAKTVHTSHNPISQHPDGNCHIPVHGTPCSQNVTTVGGGRGSDYHAVQGGSVANAAHELATDASSLTACSGHTAARAVRVGAIPVPKLLLGSPSTNKTRAMSGASPSPCATQSIVLHKPSMLPLRADPARSKLPAGWHLVVPSGPEYDHSHMESFTEADASHMTPVGPEQLAGGELLSSADSEMQTPVRRSGASHTVQKVVRFGRTRVSPSKLSSIVTPCSSIRSRNAGTPGGYLRPNMGYMSPAAISTALLKSIGSVPVTPEACEQSLEGQVEPSQQVRTISALFTCFEHTVRILTTVIEFKQCFTFITDNPVLLQGPVGVCTHHTVSADAAQLWTRVTGKPASPDVSLPCYDFVTSLFMYCMSRPPSDIERYGVLDLPQ